ncbi:hypothetical protein AVEN_66075-1 [Araneus ventricosus]|uniref:Uncharacterized protein n=1 Tax=Araneus ventricosus TaxID=182803 RepID=A0A4Y2R1U7_ARAVE|nr:hypothetical protein AVEN_66075-1 [Araneus ventricosus]
MDLVIFNHGQMTRMTPDVASPSKLPSHTIRRTFHPPMYALTCNRLNTRRVFRGIGFRTWKPSDHEADTLPLGHRCLTRNLEVSAH